MKCNICGAEIDANSINCPSCGVAVQRPQVNANVQNYNTQSMNGTMNGQVNQPMQQPMNGQMNRPMQQPMNGQMNRPMQQPMNGQMNRPMQQPMNGQMNRPMQQPMNGQMNRPVQQPMNGQYANYYANNTNNGNTKGNNVIRNCIIVVIAVAVLVLAGFGVYFLVTGNNKGGNNTSNGTFSSGQNQENNGSSNIPSSSSYIVNFGGFKFHIPDNLIYEMSNQDSALNIGDAESTWIAQLSIASNVQFSQAKNGIAKLRQNMLNSLTQKGVSGNVSEGKVESIDGKEFIIFETSYGGKNTIVAITELNPSTSLVAEVATTDNDYDKDILKNLVPIVKNAEYVGVVKKLEEKIKIKDDANIVDAIKIKE